MEESFMYGGTYIHSKHLPRPHLPRALRRGL